MSVLYKTRESRSLFLSLIFLSFTFYSYFSFSIIFSCNFPKLSKLMALSWSCNSTHPQSFRSQLFSLYPFFSFSLCNLFLFDLHAFVSFLSPLLYLQRSVCSNILVKLSLYYFSHGCRMDHEMGTYNYYFFPINVVSPIFVLIAFLFSDIFKQWYKEYLHSTFKPFKLWSVSLIGNEYARKPETLDVHIHQNYSPFSVHT